MIVKGIDPKKRLQLDRKRLLRIKSKEGGVAAEREATVIEDRCNSLHNQFFYLLLLINQISTKERDVAIGNFPNSTSNLFTPLAFTFHSYLNGLGLLNIILNLLLRPIKLNLLGNIFPMTLWIKYHPIVQIWCTLLLKNFRKIIVKNLIVVDG